MNVNLQEVWSGRISAYQASGQTMKAWCAEQSLSVDQLKYWLYKARRQGVSSGSATTFRAVAVTNQTAEPEQLWIQVGHARILLRSGFDPGLLRKVVTALEPLC